MKKTTTGTYWNFSKEPPKQRRITKGDIIQSLKFHMVHWKKKPVLGKGDPILGRFTSFDFVGGMCKLESFGQSGVIENLRVSPPQCHPPPPGHSWPYKSPPSHFFQALSTRMT